MSSKLPSVDQSTDEDHQPITKNFSNLQVDYVIVFSLSPLPNQNKLKKQAIDERSKHTKELLEEYQLLIQRLKSAGLSATSRPGSKGSNQLLILVTAHNETRIKQEIQAERIADWLHGITCVKPESDLASSFISQPHTPADRLRHLYNIITRDVQPNKSESPITAHPHRPLVGIGAGIIPKQAPFEHVQSIFPPHDTGFNQTWLSQWSDRSHLTIQIPEVELDRIKEIYGESIGFYFAFLNFYFQALIFPTGLGLIFWLTGMTYSSIYSFTLAIWSIIFLEIWKVKEKLLAINWNSFNCHKVEKKRVEFIHERVVKHLVTHEPVGYFPWWKRESRRLVTIPVLILFALGISALITVITAVELVVAEVYTGPFKKALALLPTVLFAASVPQLVGLWQSTAIKLSNWENHSYNSTYDRSLTHKVFAVHGLVAYAGLVLTAFIYVPFGTILVPHLAGLAHRLMKQETIRLEGSADQYLNTRALDFSTYSINTARLYEQLFAYQVTNQIVDTFSEVGLPYLIKIVSFRWNKLRSEREVKRRLTKNSPEIDPSSSSVDPTAATTTKTTTTTTAMTTDDAPDEHELLERLREEAKLPEYRLFVEYAEMAIQFGYVVLWTAVWPISPLFSCVNNFFELRTDAIKLAKHSRRPIPSRCDSIGPWLDVLSTLTWLGVIVNGLLVHLFQPSGRAVEKGLKHEEGATKSPTTIVADLFAAAIVETKGGSECEGTTLYERLAGMLLSALIPVLVSEHGFFLIRFFIREAILRLYWKDSPAALKQMRADWNLKQSFVDRLDFNDLQLPPTADEYFLRSLVHHIDPHHPDLPFWSRDDPALHEINSLMKTE
ncbi:uncharacterized protein PGTG_11885 [Puccinia graminis f. sp. tritici CRL 75-36-700-3]|uniref:Uncharacterized protein n=1 Tax=Puccinia graminis f. sp. tritici (strain CRL 75-36-700-3 / race SCCL) TaxID=418459 RepID=E3KMK4_PUCGT|nr:uncharacterized protein PGTG_11885 [Puccinia graminis f. sp. tritici CRL 75-36-700-3]EFP85529.2 hypothetical protein PGTG_11885 [Puccinia graminis f. sp. tritici CRL 75-36-700-3]